MTKTKTDRLTAGVTGQPVSKVCLYVSVLVLTLQFGIHVDVREAAQHSHDLVVLLLPQEAQHAASVGVLETHQVLEAPNFVLERTGQAISGPVARQKPQRTEHDVCVRVRSSVTFLEIQ